MGRKISKGYPWVLHLEKAWNFYPPAHYQPGTILAHQSNATLIQEPGLYFNNNNSTSRAECIKCKKYFLWSISSGSEKTGCIAIKMLQLSRVMLKHDYDTCCCNSKQRLGWHQPSQAFFWYDAYYKILSVKTTEYNSVVSVIPKEGLAGTGPPKPTFGMTPTPLIPSSARQAKVT